MAKWQDALVYVEKGVNSECVNIQCQVCDGLFEWQVSIMKVERAWVALDIVNTSKLNVLFFCLCLQFQNNNSYMNMAEANGALLAAGDVSILNFFPF